MMEMWELLILAVGLSMDAFAIAICKGLSVEKMKSVGWKPLALGVLLWVTISVLSLLAVLNFG